MSTVWIGQFECSHNPSLVDLHGMEQLTYTDEYLLVENCDNLVSLNGLQNLETAGNLVYIRHNPKLANLDGLIGLRYATNIFYVQNNSMLNDVSGLCGLESTNTDFAFTDLPNLCSSHVANVIDDRLAGSNSNRNGLSPNTCAHFECASQLCVQPSAACGTHGSCPHPFHPCTCESVTWSGSDCETYNSCESTACENKFYNAMNRLQNVLSLNDFNNLPHRRGY